MSYRAISAVAGDASIPRCPPDALEQGILARPRSSIRLCSRCRGERTDDLDGILGRLRTVHDVSRGFDKNIRDRVRGRRVTREDGHTCSGLNDPPDHRMPRAMTQSTQQGRPGPARESAPETAGSGGKISQMVRRFSRSLVSAMERHCCHKPSETLSQGTAKATSPITTPTAIHANANSQMRGRLNMEIAWPVKC